MTHTVNEYGLYANAGYLANDEVPEAIYELLLGERNGRVSVDVEFIKKLANTFNAAFKSKEMAWEEKNRALMLLGEREVMIAEQWGRFDD